MNSKIKRLVFAAFLSGTGIAATFAWYKSTDKSHLNSGEVPLAQVGNVSDEVLRRPPTRLLWHTVNTGDALFNGEAIRTSQAGEVRIQFEDGRYIDIEPDSLIVLSKAQGEISLDLMEGGLFVNAKADGAGGAPGDGLVLNSAQGKVDLSGAAASLSKADGQKLNLQVVEGSAKVQSKDGKTKELSSGSSGTIGSSGLQFDANQIKVISPQPNKSYYIDPAKRPDIAFEWSGFPKEWKVSAWVGPQRRQLKEFATTNAAGIEKLTSALPLGKHYWKLVATDPATNEVRAESPVYRLDVLARTTPTLMAPVHNSTIEIENFPTQVQFVWQKPDDESQLILEVAKDARLQQKVITQKIEDVDRYTLDKLEAGQYFWRMSSYYPDAKEPWSGPIQNFKLIKKVETKPIAVNVNWEKTNAEQFFIEDPDLKLSWSAGEQTPLVAQWKVSWKEEADANPAQSIETLEKQFKTKVAKPGRYVASVEAYDKQGRLMGKSESLTVAVEPKPTLPAPQLLPAEGQIVSQADGRGELNWTHIPGAKEYELKVVDKEGKELLNKRLKNNKMTLVNLMPGEYNVNLITIDEHGRPSPTPTTRSLMVPDKSNLRAPAVKKVKVN